MWEQFAPYDLHQFRYFSLLLHYILLLLHYILLLHYNERCQEIFAHLGTLPSFRPLWRKALAYSQLPSIYQKPYTYRHAEWGDVRYMVNSLPEHTPYGYLYVAKITPQDEAIEHAIQQMRKESQPGVLWLMPWPGADFPQPQFGPVHAAPSLPQQPQSPRHQAHRINTALPHPTR